MFLFMDSHSITLLLILIVLIFCSAFFSATETAFSSLSRIRLKNLAAGGNRRAGLTLDLAERYDELLSTILVGNNLVNIASTAIATVLFTRALGEGAGPTVSTIVMTVLVLIFGEVGPKSLAKEVPESFAMKVAPVVRVLMVLLKPVNFLFGKFKAGLQRLFKVHGDRAVTDSELLTLVEEARQEGGIDAQESQMLRNVIEFDDIEAIAIMTPRVDVEALPVEATPEEIARRFRETGYSRLPVYEDTIDSIVGVLHEKNFYNADPAAQADLRSLLKPAEFIPPSMKISDLLRRLQQNKLHLAVIVDEFGGTEGVVTLEDVIEELVGEIWDEHDEIVQETYRPLDRDTVQVSCTTDLDDLFEHFGLTDETEASTVNGWLTQHLERIPAVGDSFLFGGYEFTVLKAQGNRAEEISVRTVHKEQ